MINNKEKKTKLLRLKNIYDMLEHMTKTRKSERLNSAINYSDKTKLTSSHKKILKKINVINRNPITKYNEKLNKDKILDIVQREDVFEKIKPNINFKTSSVNIIKFKGLFKTKQNVQIQTDRAEKLTTNKSLILSKEYQYNNDCRTIMEYRMKKFRQKIRNKNDEDKTNSPVFKTVKNINFPSIFSISNSNSVKAHNNYFDLITNESKRKLNIKKYYNALTNLRIKLHGNILITRKSKDIDLKNSINKKMGINISKPNLKRNSIKNINTNFIYRNIGKREQICSFSNKMIRESLSDAHMKKMLSNFYK